MKYKVIYTDYETAIIYTCRHVSADGTCPRNSQQVDILSRKREIDADTRSRLHNIIKENLCLSPADFVIPAHEGQSSKHNMGGNINSLDLLIIKEHRII